MDSQYPKAAWIPGHCSLQESLITTGLDVLGDPAQVFECDIDVNKHAVVTLPVLDINSLRYLVQIIPVFLSWYFAMNANSSRARSNSPAATSASVATSQSPAKNQAYCGRLSPREGPYPATSPQPSNGLQTHA